MKIGIMVRTIEEKQGIGLYTLNLLDNLFRIDQRNEYVLFYRNTTYFDRYDELPNVTKVLSSVPTKLLWDQVAVPWIARRYDLDLLFNTKFSVPLLSGAPTAMVMHGSEWYVYPKHYKALDVWSQSIMLRVFLKKARMVISVSERAKIDVVKFAGGDPERFHTIHLAANDRFRVISDRQYLDRVRKENDLPSKFIVWVGKIYPGKNVGNLIRAYHRIADQVPHSLLLVGGVRWNYERDLALIDELGLRDRVILKDWVAPEDLPAYYNLADVFAFPSWYESCPAPPWEAMGCGCPVVTTRTGGTPEVAGDAAVYVDPASVSGIAEGLLKALTDEELRADLIEKGFRNVKRFSWEQTARKTLEAFESQRPAT